MVDINQIRSVLSQFEELFLRVKNDSENSSDVHGASYGLSKVKFVRDLLDKYEKCPEDKFLKQVDSGFVSITRGVEGFGDYEINKKFYSLFNEIPDIKSHIKW